MFSSSFQGAFTQQQEALSIKSDSVQNLVTVDPETVLVQADGQEEVVVASEDSQSPYVIQYRYVTEDGQEIITDKMISDVQVEEVTVGDFIGDNVSLQEVTEVIGQDMAAADAAGSEITESQITGTDVGDDEVTRAKISRSGVTDDEATVTEAIGSEVTNLSVVESASMTRNMKVVTRRTEAVVVTPMKTLEHIETAEELEGVEALEVQQS